mgnify:CR=1 FL=1|jgi:hypothetical protein
MEKLLTTKNALLLVAVFVVLAVIFRCGCSAGSTSSGRGVACGCQGSRPVQENFSFGKVFSVVTGSLGRIVEDAADVVVSGVVYGGGKTMEGIYRAGEWVKGTPTPKVDAKIGDTSAFWMWDPKPIGILGI